LFTLNKTKQKKQRKKLLIKMQNLIHL